MKAKPIVWIEGSIGSGKSQIASQLSEKLKFRCFSEPVLDKGYLELFYSDPKRWAFSFQVEMLRRRWDIHRLAMLEARVGNVAGVLLDRGLPGDFVFGGLHRKAGNIHELEWQTYKALYQEFMSVPNIQPTMLIYLNVTPEKALARIKKRARPSEENITLQYLSDLQEAYLKLIYEIEGGKHPWSHGMQIVRIEWTEDHLSVDPVISQISQKLVGLPYKSNAHMIQNLTV